MTMAFPAIRGRQGKRDYYVAMFPLGLIPRLFVFTDYASLPPEQRAQRVLVKSRVPQIAKYILENEDGWVFSSLTASFDADEAFEPASKLSSDVGLLRLPLNTQFLINDGQHRRAAIEEALMVNPGLAEETVSVVLFPRESLERDQQIFSDLNRTVQKTSRSLDILYDHRDPLNQLALDVGEKVPLFRGRLEKDRISLSARSGRFITLSALYDANKQFVGKVNVADDAELDELCRRTVDYWRAVTEVIPDWKAVADGQLFPKDVRAESVDSSTVCFFALGRLGNAVWGADQSWSRLDSLSSVDWRKINPDWQGICMLGPDIITRRQTKETMSEYLLWVVGLIDDKPRPVFTPA